MSRDVSSPAINFYKGPFEPLLVAIGGRLKK